MSGGETCHWLTFAGASENPKPLLPDGFLAGPENRLAETAVHWALGGVPFFADSPDSTALLRAVSEGKKRTSRKKSAHSPSLNGTNSELSAVPNTENIPFHRAAYPLRPDPNAPIDGFPPVIDYTPLVHLPYAFPLLFYGPSGSGKSHLAHGIFQQFLHLNSSHLNFSADPASNTPFSEGKRGTKWKESNIGSKSRKKGIYLSGDDFYQTLTRAVAERRTEEWRDYFAECGIVVFDGIHALAGRAAAQRELLAVLALCERSKTLLILTCLAPPHRLDDFAEPLTARLSAGLCVPVFYPGTESRRTLIKRLAELAGVRLTADALAFLTEALPPSVGAMTGAFRQMREIFGWPKKPVSIPKMRLFLEERHPEKVWTLDEIARKSAEHFAVKLSDLRSKSRTKTTVLARNMAIYLARTQTAVTLQELGRWFGGRDHTTILHGFRDIEARLESDTELAAARDAILKESSPP